jgi:hypothetical protein
MYIEGICRWTTFGDEIKKQISNVKLCAENRGMERDLFF